MLRLERRTNYFYTVKVQKNVFEPLVAKYESLSKTHLFPVYPVRQTETTTIKTSCIIIWSGKGWPGFRTARAYTGFLYLPNQGRIQGYNLHNLG